MSERPSEFQLFETAYDNFLGEFTLSMREFKYTLEDACRAWEDYFGYDAQDPLVDFAMEHHYEWVFPEEE